jgi:Zn-dependent protease
MAWQDRPYYRDRSDSTGNPLMWLLTGSVPLFTAFGIRVRAHASMIVYAVLVLLLGLGTGFTWQDRVQNVTVLFAIVLLHEFGHCFTARWVGGSADEIVMHPLGGLALASPPRRPLPSFLTVAGGPAVNVLICLVCGAILWTVTGRIPTNPFNWDPYGAFDSWFDVYRYAWWVFQISWSLLIFNLLPIFPLDGGQMLQAILWPHIGYFKSMNLSCIVGMIGAALGGMVALATLNIGLAILAAFGFLYCLNLRRALLAAGPEEQNDLTDYSAAYEPDAPARRRDSRRAQRRAAKLAKQEATEQQRIDQILAKVSAHGMHSLSWWEKRTLKQATERQRHRDLERSRLRRGN